MSATEDVTICNAAGAGEQVELISTMEEANVKNAIEETMNSSSLMENGENCANEDNQPDLLDADTVDTGTDDKDLFTQLPTEVLEKICDLNYKYIKNLRLTCSVLKQLIDTRVGLLYSFNEDSTDIDLKEQLKFISNKFCLRALVTKTMIGKEGSDGVRRYFNQEFSFEDLICYPDCLRALIIKERVHVQFLFDALSNLQNLEYVIVGNIHLEGDLLPLLIKEESKDKIKKVGINRDAVSWSSILSPKNAIIQQIKFTKLKAFILQFKSTEPGNKDLLHAMLLLSCIRSETLMRADIRLLGTKNVSEMEYFHLSMVMAEFIDAHKDTLKEFAFGVQPSRADPVSHEEFEQVLSNTFNKQLKLVSEDIEGGGGDSVDDKSRMIVILRQKLEAIAKVSHLRHLYITVFPDYHWDFWLVFIENLRNLVTLYILASPHKEILENFEFIKNSSKSLKRLRLDLIIQKDFDIDFSGIEECEKLEEVFLRCRSLRQDINLSSLCLNGMNCQLIPGGLKMLSLSGIILPSDDLNKMLSNQKKLETLVIICKTVHPASAACLLNTNFPVYPDCKCLKKIFRMRNLQSCLIQNLRAASKKTYERLLEMLDFQLDDGLRDVLRGWVTSYAAKTQDFPILIQQAYLSVVSTEGYQPYIWERSPNTFPYSLDLNSAAKDPYCNWNHIHWK